jgi:hypothetical protein
LVWKRLMLWYQIFIAIDGSSSLATGRAAGDGRRIVRRQRGGRR